MKPPKTTRYQLKNIGRGKFCGIVEVTSELALYKEVKKHLASKHIDLIWNDDGSRALVEAGFHSVGEVIKL